ncbi:MAG: AI-2E family transporter, partial [Bacteroidota bacterium]
MTAKTLSNGILRAVAIIAGAVLFCYFIYAIRSVVAYIAIAGVVALLGRPIILFLRNKLKFPNTLAVVATMVLMLGIFFGILALFIPLISEQSKNLSLLDLEELIANLNTLYFQIVEYFGMTTDGVNDLLQVSG